MSLLNMQRVQRTNTMNTKETKMPEYSLDHLDTLKEAKKITKRIPVPLKCVTKYGRVVFFTQLEGDKSIGIEPVMPKNEAGEALAPLGEEGYLTIQVSENAKITVDKDNTKRLIFTERPIFADWQKLEAPKKTEAPKK